MKNNRFSQKITVFQGRYAPEEGYLVGYGAIINAFHLELPYPDTLCLISLINHKNIYIKDDWQVYPSVYLPEDNLLEQLVFAIRYEGINLLFFKKLFAKLSEKEITELVQAKPLGQYCRKIWFLYEWLEDKQLEIPDLKSQNFVPIINPKLQYGIDNGKKSKRHRIINNLPGTCDLCPLIYKTEKLEKYIAKDFLNKSKLFSIKMRKDLLQRAAAFLLLKDSKASFNIEGEKPNSKRTARWGRAIGQAGAIDISKDELLRLQQIVIESDRFIKFGFRQEGGFVGEHDRITAEPVPSHISARAKDLDKLINGLIETTDLLLNSDLDAVLAASIIAFGFVFIHPFEDGNGRLHRYLIHHILGRKNYFQQGLVFPISASILDHIDDYRRVLEKYSLPLLDFIEWQETEEHNVEVLNDTIDFYRYFDITKQAEFLFDCVNDTIENIIPEEIKYLENYEDFKHYLDDKFEMTDKTVALLIRFLERDDGVISKRAKAKEFSMLSDNEIKNIENKFKEFFLS